MGTLKSNVTLAFGLVTCTVSVFSAVETKSRNVQVCADGHAPAKISQQIRCPECGDIDHSKVCKAREVPDGLVLLTADDLSTVGADAEQFKARIGMTPHPIGQVDGATAPGAKGYFLVPAKGQETTYAVLAKLIGAHPELAFCARWTPRSAMGVFWLKTVDGANGPVLLMQERVAGDGVKAAPEFAGPDVAVVDTYLTLAEKILKVRGKASPIEAFSLDAYRDTSADKIAAIVAERTPLAALTVAGSQPASVDTLSQFQAMLDKVGATQRRPRRASLKAAS